VSPQPTSAVGRGSFLYLPMELNTVYFYTVAILNWISLLETEKFKTIVLNSLIHLVQNKTLIVYAFVVMPNHIHIIWECKAKNGKEMPHASFMKFTGHEFLKELRAKDSPLLNKFKVDGNSRNHQFWQKNALPIIMYDRKILEQKLDYIHYNPLQLHWN
jgi:putative transposase